MLLFFTTDIKPIFEKNYTSCHNTNKKAGYYFFTLEAAKRSAANGELLGTAKHSDGFSEMPAMVAKIDQETIDKIECWITTRIKE